MKKKSEKVTKSQAERQFDFRNTYVGIAEVQEAVSILMYDEDRGHWGTEVELALTTAEADLASAMEQLEFVRQKRGWQS